MKTFFRGLVLLLCLSGAAGAAERIALIQPPAGLSWEDGLEETVRKLGAIPGVESVVLGNGIYGHSENVKGMDGDALRERLIRSYGRYTGDGAFANPDLEAAGYFIDGQGNRIPFHEGQPAEVTVRPVVLCGIPFELKLECVHSPGLAVRFPGRVLLADEGKSRYALSMVLRRVTLSRAVPISSEKIKAIRDMIIGEFARFKGGLSSEKNSVWGKVEDADGTLLAVDISMANGFLSYSSRHYHRELDEAYREYRSGIENGNGNKSSIGAR